MNAIQTCVGIEAEPSALKNEAKPAMVRMRPIPAMIAPQIRSPERTEA